jgi:hypothetical protein
VLRFWGSGEEFQGQKTKGATYFGAPFVQTKPTKNLLFTKIRVIIRFTGLDFQEIPIIAKPLCRKIARLLFLLFNIKTITAPGTLPDAVIFFCFTLLFYFLTFGLRQ